MSDKPSAIVRIDDLASNLRNTMARAPDVFPPSLRRQLAQIVSSYLRSRIAGSPFIHPGMAKMAKWGQCSDRHARRNFSKMQDWGVVSVVAYPRGGRRASRFVVNFGGIKMLLVEMGTNPSAALFGKISDAENPDINPDIKAAKNPDICPDTMSAGILSTGRGHLSPENRLLKIVGGRDA